MTASTPGPAAPLIEQAAQIIVDSQDQPHTAPYHWAGALYEAGMLVSPGADEVAKPNLGLATTRELLAELTARIEIDGYAGGGGLDYRTVDSR